MDLPSSWRFLGPMWWVLHVAAIGLVFYIGYAIGKSSARDGDEDPQEPWHKREEREAAGRAAGDGAAPSSAEKPSDS